MIFVIRIDQMTERFLSYHWLITHHCAASFLSLQELACADRVFCMGWDCFSSVVIFLSHIMSTGSGGRRRKELASCSPCWCWISLSASKAAAPADHFIRNAWWLSSRAHPPRIHPSGACRWNLHTSSHTNTITLVSCFLFTVDQITKAQLVWYYTQSDISNSYLS